MGMLGIGRINELYYKSQAIGLTEKKKEKQARLRREYIVAIRGSLRNNLNSISIQEENDSVMSLGKKHGGIGGV